MPDPSAISEMLANLTETQRRAVLTVDRSLLVSAAAGSGKTTVLAERCAALVCDLPEGPRCNINEMLVLTFTKAAAAEMRTRIGKAIQKRIDRFPNKKDYLLEQLYQLDNADISTIHSFCQTLIQRWFPQAGVDPQAAVLAEDESELLRRETLDDLFAELYEGKDELALGFQTFVDEYGSGHDEQITPIILHLYSFLMSLIDPDDWLKQKMTAMDPASPEGVIARLNGLQHQRLSTELTLQVEYARDMAATIRRCWPVAESRAEDVDKYVGQLELWIRTLQGGAADAWQEVAKGIVEHTITPAKRKPSKLPDDVDAAYDAAKKVRGQLPDLLERLKKGFCLFDADGYRKGMEQIAPHVRILTELVAVFGRRYQSAKSERAVVDFDDLQRYAYRLLSEDGDPDRPSEVARRLQQRYRYILVDEFQDVDPLQVAILRLISGETANPAHGNLFAVGDIKQSIYRFRLAEPAIFKERAERFGRGCELGTLIHLQDNFRSRDGIISAINLVFRSLMSSSFGGSDYDESAQLYAKMKYPDRIEPPPFPDAASAAAATSSPNPGAVFGRPAVELHLLEPITEQTRQAHATSGETTSPESEERGEDEPEVSSDRADTDAYTEELEGIEREGFLIAGQIRQWFGDNTEGQRCYIADRPLVVGGPPTMRPIEYRDIVILLRSLPHKAKPIAEILRRMSIPVRIEGQSSGLGSTEFNDILSLLKVLDNRQQDIPLAAVLRSPLLPERFNETDLFEVRLLDRTIPFHAAVTGYAREGPDEHLRHRLAVVIAWLDRYRVRIRQAPVAQVLWEIFEETQYLAYVGGLPGGAQRRDDLLRLHEMARRFGRFSRQGLRRFLRYIEELEDRDRQPEQTANVQTADDVVRIMTIHKSKGLEFPVVIMADLGKEFNLGETNASVVVDREYGIALQATDSERRIRYPTLIHQLASEHSRQEQLSEELRVLYVALTRAREHLILVGRKKMSEIDRYKSGRPDLDGSARRIPALALKLGKSYLDWLLPAVSMKHNELIQWYNPADRCTGQPLFKIYVHDRATTDHWKVPPMVESGRMETLSCIAGLEPLPKEETMATESAVTEILAGLAWEYPGLELTTLPARKAVTEMKRQDFTIDTDEFARPAPTTVEMDHEIKRKSAPPADGRMATAGSSSYRVPLFHEGPDATKTSKQGSATHRFLQLVNMARSCDREDLVRQRDELVEQGLLSAADAGQITMEDVAWFFADDLGRRIRSRSADVRREIPFASRIGPDKIDPLLKPRDHRDVVLVRGMIDLVLVGSSELELIDYKTDRVRFEDVPSRAQEYSTQIELYTSALEAIYRRPVSRRSLVFLHARRIHEG